MSINFILQLTDEELLELHKVCFCDDLEPHVDKCINYDDQMVDLTFYENWPEENGDAAYVPTEYSYDDFGIPRDLETWGENERLAQKFYWWMANRFGKEYLVELLSSTTGIRGYELKRLMK